MLRPVCAHTCHRNAACVCVCVCACVCVSGSAQLYVRIVWRLRRLLHVAPILRPPLSLSLPPVAAAAPRALLSLSVKNEWQRQKCLSGTCFCCSCVVPAPPAHVPGAVTALCVCAGSVVAEAGQPPRPAPAAAVPPASPWLTAYLLSLPIRCRCPAATAWRVAGVRAAHTQPPTTALLRQCLSPQPLCLSVS
eukprot:COSAG03_NODE_6550_length_1042_cov_1.013786_1_plen_191_part_10